MIKKVLLGASFLLLFSGCAGQTKEQEEKAAAATTAPNAETKPSTAAEQQEAKPKEVEVPEPYSIALKKIEAGELDTALTYLDFTINDFKDSPYVYNAQLLKSVLWSSKFTAHLNLGNSLAKGSGKAPFLYKKEELVALKNQLKQKSKDIKEYGNSLAAPAQYIWENYSAEKSVPPFKDIKPPSVPPERDLDFFVSVGYPAPKEDEMKAYVDYMYISLTSTVLQLIIKEDKVEYPGYFYFIGASLLNQDQPLSRKFLDKTIELTENDKYSEVRIQAQEFIDNVFN
ncbi:hypothetical protein YDYSY3_47340 [Paenibacillus chitinolyticus]|uniref:hypothetical protein n=1 Tax=Paenibacillus chitinolyticus TaxID=79263 RepID=UPI0026E4D4B0|nr:hypothetical protein [Paenibacillus chitinolyticus]GKS13734.1 hypothetical protein YDYSY3_47340 [Paenibacillus chitinolyticus]